MKRLIIFGLLTVIALNISANVMGSDTEVPMTDVNEGHTNNGGHRSSAQIPTVYYNDNLLYVISPSYIEEAEIIIYDEYGSAIYSITTSLSVTVNTFILPQSVTEGKYSIEIIYSGHDLVGYF